MPIQLTLHKGDRLKRYVVPLHCPNGFGPVDCIVFATSIAEAEQAAIDKMTDKWYRHQGKRTEWKLDGTIREC